ncbi:hypothetical protein AQUCO_02100115v1 [Aquilegia coerulea]|uniref:F-box domain-containing protein n=1 Tax=Aquilegia coerulea TaxID=218851 RepID=A0A2G5DEU2_AQUCA|nr:hypothetical protein AQUCO_02100115v1 [Aquilegia coerulea]
MADFINIPCDILIDIFSRIPIKSLVQLRCVSKSLLHFITDSLVFNMHVSYSKNLKILLNDFNCCYALDCISWGSSNGLILLSFDRRYDDKVYCLWNPYTGEYIKANLHDSEMPFNVSVYYNSTDKNYDFLVIQYHESNVYDRSSCVDIYSLASSSWREMKSIPYRIATRHGVSVDGSLHWVAAHKSRRSYRYDLVIAFEIGGDKFREVPLPNHMNPDCFIDITELGGELCLVCNYKILAEAWLMKDYGVTSSWTKLFSIKASPGVYFRSLMPLCFTKDGKLLLHMDDRMLALYHPIEDLFCFNIKGIPQTFVPIIYYENQIVMKGENNKMVL